MKLSKYLELLFNYTLYNNQYRNAKSLLKKEVSCTKDEIEEYQFQKLRAIIEYACKNVPYYRDLFRNIGFQPEDFKSIQDIKKIPFLTKNIVREQQDQLVSTSFNPKYIKIASTGGTTGLPMAFYLDKRTTSLIEMAYLEDIWDRIGYRRYDKCILLREDTVPNIIPGKKYWKMNYFLNWLILSSFHFNADTFMLYYQAITSFKPAYIVAFPSNAYLLARFIDEYKLPNFPSVKGIICSSENLYAWQREFVEGVFKARIISYYGHSEKCVIASECKDSHYFEFYPFYGYTELINDNDAWCTREDEPGEIVATGFNNLASPFIRYRTEDIGIFANNKCIDHPDWFALKRIEGRKQNFIINRDGTPISAMHIDRPFWEIRNDIYAYQYVQDVPGRITVNIHAREPLNDHQIEEIRRKFLEIHFKFDIDIQQVDYIPRTNSGKFCYLIQNIKLQGPINTI
jgi:phenylacetate-CoA ligase